MLVLARKVGQSIIIGDNVEIVVVEVRGDQVRLGITAPRSIAVHRKELLEQIRAENLEAASTSGINGLSLQSFMQNGSGNKAPEKPDKQENWTDGQTE